MICMICHLKIQILAGVILESITAFFPIPVPLLSNQKTGHEKMSLFSFHSEVSPKDRLHKKNETNTGNTKIHRLCNDFRTHFPSPGQLEWNYMLVREETAVSLPCLSGGRTPNSLVCTG